MPADVIKFVDSIAASPTTRLDLNDEVSWWVRSFSAPPPRLRRSQANNAMRDGIYVGSSSYDARTMTIELEVRKSTQDLAATEIQKLWRELDRTSNFLMYQPNGLTKPVFFRTYRSDTSQLADVMAQAAMRTFTIEVLAEPFALGLRETLGPYTVSNNPAAGSNGCHFDVTGVIGDVAVPPVLINTSNQRYAGLLAVRQRGVPSNLPWFGQLDSLVTGADTTNPGGGPDAVMSGTGTNNYVRTSFATTPAMSSRVTGFNPFAGATSAQQAEIPGTYRLVVAVRRSDATSVINVMAQGASTDFDGLGKSVAVPLTSGRLMVDLGVVHYDLPTRQPGGVAPSSLSGMTADQFVFSAQRVSGAGTLDWDCAFLVPADTSTLLWSAGAGGSSTVDMVIDAAEECVYNLASGVGDLFAGTASITVPVLLRVGGGFPTMIPGQTNRFYLLTGSDAVSGTTAVTISDSWAVHYHPRYLYVRPVSS